MSQHVDFAEKVLNSPHVSVVDYAEHVLKIKLMPWQKEALLRAENPRREYRNVVISHPRGFGRRSGIKTVLTILDECARLDPIDMVRQVAAKYLPHDQHADTRLMPRMLDLGR